MGVVSLVLIACCPPVAFGQKGGRNRPFGKAITPART